MSVDRITVLAAYRQLRDEGVLEFRRGRSARVLSAGPASSFVTTAAPELIATAEETALTRPNSFESSSSRDDLTIKTGSSRHAVYTGRTTSWAMVAATCLGAVMVVVMSRQVTIPGVTSRLPCSSLPSASSPMS